VLRWLLGRRITWGSYRIDGRAIRMSEMDAWMDRNTNQAASWDDIARLRSRWKGNLVVKGVMTQADARLAIDHGTDGVFVSNHGGRQFDGQLATIEALPSVVDAVDGRAAVIMDGGIRRGSDIAKALSLGADAAAAGRPFALGLAAAGRPGVERAFDVLHDELLTVMGFLGVTRIEGLPESLCASHDLSDGIEAAR
jgi:L-lactate dehydrogenase (cytochrome)/(S)-mandelate dehydrogenase